MIDDDELSIISLNIANEFRERIIIKKYFNNWKKYVFDVIDDENNENRMIIAMNNNDNVNDIRIDNGVNNNNINRNNNDYRIILDKKAKYLQNKINLLNNEISRLQLSKNHLRFQRILVFIFIFIILFLIAFLIFTFYFRFYTKIHYDDKSKNNAINNYNDDGDDGDDIIDFQEHFILLFLWILSIVILSGITLKLFFSKNKKKTKPKSNPKIKFPIIVKDINSEELIL